ncbi:MAG: hypothetical protein NTY10_03075 [Candidatus Omnitrophica bacterium]|nr:hypothetical protein [Candidatus Omnitrophota bacterium]
MDTLKSMRYPVRKTLEVLRHRFLFRGRIRKSEFLDLFSDNLPKIIPGKMVGFAYRFLDKLVDKFLWF